MSRTRSALRNRLEWLAVAGGLSVLEALPAGAAMRVMSGLGRVGGALSRTRSAQAERCAETRLGVAPGRARRIVRESFRSLALNVVEPHLLERALRSEAFEERVDVEGAEHLDRVLAEDRGVLIATAHFGAWETLGVVLARRFKPIWAVARALDNPLLRQWMVDKRGRALAGTLDKSGGGLKLARLVKGGEIVALLLDQNAGRQGVILDFLGQPSLHHRVAGVMACRFGAAVLPTYLYRAEGELRLRLVIEPPVEPDPGLAAEEAEVDVVRRVSRSLERRVREQPEQWMWLHDRWRRAQSSLAKEAREAAMAATRPTEDVTAELAETES